VIPTLPWEGPADIAAIANGCVKDVFLILGLSLFKKTRLEV
jgi:hypothetical protein